MVSSTILILAVLVGFLSLTYFYVLMGAAVFRKKPRALVLVSPRNRFLILVAAHNEASVVGDTVTQIFGMHFPRDRYEVHVVADHCNDQTAEIARRAGAHVHVRDRGERGKKSAALAWLYNQLRGADFDAVVIFDADAHVDPDFLLGMNSALMNGHVAIQGRQLISNSNAGWYPAMTSAMYRIDNFVHNQGRCQLGGSARNMGDSICLRKDIVEKCGFGDGITEDHVLRQRILLSGRRIYYEPRAVSYNEAAQTWASAKIQRTRWMKGTIEADKHHGRTLLREGFSRRSFALFEAGLESVLPAYSTLAVFSVVGVISSLLFGSFGLQMAWGVLLAGTFLFPLLGLLLAKAPARDFAALLAGPFFILWRVYLSISMRLFPKEVEWQRTPHGISAK